jgi:archaellum component FlaC
MKDVEDALLRLDKLTHEEARMAAAEALKITRGIDDKVEGVDERVKNVDTKVEGIDHKVCSVITGELYLHWSPPPNLSSTF